MATESAPPIKGSWEDLLESAQQLAANYNDDAIPIFEKLVTRLGNMPASRRHMAGERLQQIYTQAVLDLYSIMLMRERYDDAMHLFDILQNEQSPEQADILARMRVSLLVQAGLPDEAIAALNAIVQGPEADLEDLQALAMLQIRFGRDEEFEQTVAHMEQWIQARYSDEEAAEAGGTRSEPEAYRRDRAVVEMVRSTAALDHGRWDDAVKHVLKAVELDGGQQVRMAEIYTHLLFAGRHQEAVPLIRRDLGSQVRPNFWLGYAARLAGDDEKANGYWKRALAADVSKEENQQFFEWILSSYYLEGPEGLALSAVLRQLQEDEDPFWLLFYLAGLGWAIRGSRGSARTDLDMAVLHRRGTLSGQLLPPELWHHFENLVSPEIGQELAIFFDDGRGRHPFSDRLPVQPSQALDVSDFSAEGTATDG